MNIYNITGRHVDISEALHNHVRGRLDALERFGERVTDAKVIVSYATEGDSAAPAKVEAQLNLPGTSVRAEERAKDAYAAVDAVAAKLERQLKTLKGRRQAQRREAGPEAEPEARRAAPLLPRVRIVRSKRHTLRPMTPDDAVFELEMLGHSFYMFRNADTAEVNVLYLRHDGDYGLLEPAA